MTTQVVGAEQLRRQLTDLLNRVGYGGDEVIVERHGRPIAVLRPYSGYREVTEPTLTVAEQVPALAALLETARETAGVTYEELARQLHEERLRTLREKYPHFAAEFDHATTTEPA